LGTSTSIAGVAGLPARGLIRDSTRSAPDVLRPRANVVSRVSGDSLELTRCMMGGRLGILTRRISTVTHFIIEGLTASKEVQT
jgi:hypothetical protein